MLTLNTPPTDGLIDRHQFYAKLVCLVEQNSHDVNGIGHKLNLESVAFETVRDEVKAGTIRNKTLIMVAILVWTLLGSGVGIYIQRGLANYDSLTTKMVQFEKAQTIYENHMDQQKDFKENIEVLKTKVRAMEAKLYDLEANIDLIVPNVRKGR